MKYSLDWLKEISGVKIAPAKIAELLTMHSFEIEETQKLPEKLEKIIVGKILEIMKHPNADKLQLVKVDTGKNKLDIVCGAWNIKVGDKVPVALVGAKLPNGMEIKAAEIRGIKSNGMLCAEDELGLGKDHSGIIILDKNAPIGKAVREYLSPGGQVLEIKMLPNRSHDALSHVGVAREISALSGKKMVFDFEGLQLPSKKSKKLKIEIKDKKLCPRYIGAVMESIEIKDSPKWMQDRLKICGMNSINNVVDTTNYVMLEIGQPLHAFDFDKIKSINQNDQARIVVRRAKDKEKMILLDDSQIELNSSNLLITNGEESLALAGIKGGKYSGISENTKTIIIESANFDAASIRKTRIAQNLRTDASDRYEKDIDPNLASKAMARVIEILEHTAGAKLEGIIDVYPKKIQPWKIKLNLEYVNNLLGEIIPKKNIVKILNLLDVKTTEAKNIINAEIPTFRLDIKTQEDLIEEIGRVWGYEKIKSAPIIAPVKFQDLDEMLKMERKVREKAIGLGLDEVYNYSFYSKKEAEICGLDKIKHFELANPMNPNQELVRTSLIPNILKNIRENLKHFESFGLFEIGRVFYPKGTVVEKRMLTMAKVLSDDKKSDTFFEMKGAAEDFSDSLGIVPEFIQVSDYKEKIWHPGRMAQIKFNGAEVGFLGEINPELLAKYKITKRVTATEIDLEKLLKISGQEKIFKTLRKFPTVIRDISLISRGDDTVEKIMKLIRKTGGSLIFNVGMFDMFQKSGETSLAFHIEFGAKTRTLETAEVDLAMEKIILALQGSLGMITRK